MNADEICNILAAIIIGVLFLAAFIYVCFQVAKDYFKNMSMARSTNEMLRAVGSGVASLEKMEMSPPKPYHKRFPGPYATFSGIYRGRPVYVRWDNVPNGGLRIDIDHFARYQDRLFNLALFTTTTQANQTPPGQQAQMITPMLRGLCGQVQNVLGQNVSSISTMPFCDVSMAVQVQGLMTRDSLKAVLDNLSDACGAVEAQLGRLTRNDIMKRIEAPTIIQVPGLIQTFINTKDEDIRIEFKEDGIGVQNLKSKTVSSYKYQDIICLFEGDDEESVTMVFKDRSQISFSADTPLVRAGIRAIILDKLGLLERNEPKPLPSMEPTGLSR